MMAQQVPPPIGRAQLIEAIPEEYGPILRRIARLFYWRPYPARIDQIDIPQGHKVPNFTLFLGEREQLTIEHIGRLIVQCGHIENNEDMRMMLFPNSLTRVTFTKYTNLATNLVHN